MPATDNPSWDARRGIAAGSGERLALPPRAISFKFDGLVLPVFVDRRSPDLVRSLVFGAAETEIGAKTQVESARVLQGVDQLLGIELRSGTLQPLDKNVGREVDLERHVIRCLAGKVLGERILVFEN